MAQSAALQTLPPLLQACQGIARRRSGGPDWQWCCPPEVAAHNPATRLPLPLFTPSLTVCLNHANKLTRQPKPNKHAYAYIYIYTYIYIYICTHMDTLSKALHNKRQHMSAHHLHKRSEKNHIFHRGLMRPRPSSAGHAQCFG